MFKVVVCAAAGGASTSHSSMRSGQSAPTVSNAAAFGPLPMPAADRPDFRAVEARALTGRTAIAIVHPDPPSPLLAHAMIADTIIRRQRRCRDDRHRLIAQ
jgi:hypothetical protein